MGGKKMEFRQLKSFITVVKFSSFTKAADHIGYAQSTITNQIQSLEEEFNTLLFDRLGKQIKLTRDGEILYTYAVKILNLADETKDRISSSQIPKGPLIIGTAESLCTHHLSKIFTILRSCYPDIEIDIRFDACSDYRASLRKNFVDIIYFLDVPCNEPDLVSHVLTDEPMTLIAPPNHPLAKKDQITPYDLHGQSLVLTQNGCSYRRILESMLAQAGAKPSSTLGITSNEVIKKLVSDGWGIGFLPYIAVKEELANHQFVALPWAGSPFNIKVQLIYHKEKWISPAMKAFTDIILETFEIQADKIE